MPNGFVTSLRHRLCSCAVLLGTLFLLSIGAVMAAEGTESTAPSEDPAQRLVVHISTAAGQALRGAELPAPKDLTALDCEMLYARRLALYRENLSTQPDLLDDPRTQAAMFLGAIWTPAFLYLPYAAAERYLDNIERIERTAEINDLAYASSAQDCFLD